MEFWEEDEFLELFGFIYCWLHIVTGHLASLLERLILFLDGKVMPCLVKAMVFSVVMYGCESWTVKKAEH